MRLFFELVLSAAIAVGASQLLSAQDLAPRAYVITPLHANVITLTWAFYDGSINYNGALPVSGATGSYLTYARNLISWRDAEVLDHLGPLEILL